MEKAEEYRGTWNAYGCQVTRVVDGREEPLPLRLDLRDHSPTGFAWGYHGSGPAQLALALLADTLEHKREALELYQEFKAGVIALLPMEASWTMRREAILQSVRNIREAQRSVRQQVVSMSAAQTKE